MILVAKQGATAYAGQASASTNAANGSEPVEHRLLFRCPEHSDERQDWQSQQDEQVVKQNASA